MQHDGKVAEQMQVPGLELIAWRYIEFEVGAPCPVGIYKPVSAKWHGCYQQGPPDYVCRISRAEAREIFREIVTGGGHYLLMEEEAFPTKRQRIAWPQRVTCRPTPTMDDHADLME